MDKQTGETAHTIKNGAPYYQAAEQIFLLQMTAQSTIL